VCDAEDYYKIKDMRDISFHNKENKRLHFYERIDEDCFIKITVCLNKDWKHKFYKPIKGIRVLTLEELDYTKHKTVEEFDPEICEVLKIGNKKYFVRKAKYDQDEADIFLLNWLLKMRNKK
jgi:hypothetical protein